MGERLGRLAVPTPWYPGPANPYSGTFVELAVEAVQPGFSEVQVVHAEDWTTPASWLSAGVVRRCLRSLVEREPPRPVPEGPGATAVLRVPAPVVPGRDYAQHARTHEAAVRGVLPGGRFDADVVHGHVGTYGGWVAARLAPRRARVFVTEHATFLDRVLSQRHARELYDEVCSRATAVIAVSDVLRDRILAWFPHHADRIVVVPNAVPVERIPVRAAPVRDLHRWLYVGRLLPHKGVRRLVEAFAVCALDEPALRLEVLGGGPLLEPLRARVAELGLAGRVHLAGPVPHARVVKTLGRSDLLVHLSEYETFGMTVVEAVAAGTPVLVTRSGGPEETLRGLDGVAGTTVGVDDGVADVVAAYQRLRDGVSSLDLAGARRVMEMRYGMEAVGRRLHRLYREDSL